MTTKRKATKLKPCPFCGKAPVVQYGYDRTVCYVGCHNYRRCEMDVFTKWMPSEESAIEIWNRRAKR